MTTDTGYSPLYYHGTTTALVITDTLLPPEQSDKLVEVGRKKNLDKVFFSLDRKSAEIYARKAVKRFGGQPVVMTVVPSEDAEALHTMVGTSVFMASSARVVARNAVVTKKYYKQFVPLFA